MRGVIPVRLIIRMAGPGAYNGTIIEEHSSELVPCANDIIIVADGRKFTVSAVWWEFNSRTVTVWVM